MSFGAKLGKAGGAWNSTTPFMEIADPFAN
jgi:hypothetical protein